MEENQNLMSADDVMRLLEYMRDDDGTVRISIDEYMKLKTSYEEYQTKQYKITLSVTRVVVVDEDGSTKEISRLNTHEVLFPDDTETELSNLYNEVNENAKYVSHLEEKIGKLNASLLIEREANKQLKEENEKLKQGKSGLFSFFS